MSGLENSGNSIGVCSEGVLDLMPGLENSGNSIGVCSEGVLDLMSGLENGFRLYTDYSYSSPLSTIIYIIMASMLVGTASPNRGGLPKELITRLPSIIVGLWTTAPMTTSCFCLDR